MNIHMFLSSSVGRKSIMSVTGIMLGLFLLTHLLGNLTMFLGRDSFIAYADHLHSLGPLVNLAEVSLLTIFLIHVYFAVRLYFDNLSARPERYAVTSSSGGRTFSSQTMPYTGLIILLFIIVHLDNFHFADKSIPIADIVRVNFTNPVIALYYIISLLALATHTSHGFWSFFQSLGVNHPGYNHHLRQGAIIVSVLGISLYISIPVITYLYKNFLL